MEKRLAVFIVFSLVIIALYPMFIHWVSGPSPSVPLLPSDEVSTPVQNKPLEAAEQQEGEVLDKGIETVTADASETSLDQSDTSSADEGLEVLKVIESDLYRVTLSNIGGTIKKWELKKYTEKNEESGAEEPIQLVPTDVEKHPLVLSLPGEAQRIYQLDAAPLQLSASLPSDVVTMSYLGQNGEKITKEFRFSNETYLVDFKIETSGFNQDYDLSLGTNFGIHEWGKQVGRNAGGVALIDNEVVRDTPKSMEEETASYTGKSKWFALQDKYFISALIPKGDAPIDTISFKNEGENAISAKIALKPTNGVGLHDFSLYVGPKEFDRLNALDANLDESIDFGWFIFGSMLPVRMIAKPIFYLLRFVYQFTHNYGISIIFITVLIKVIFFPITQKSMKSMKSMASIQPKIEAIKKQHANNKERLNQELMKLYKTEKVNPVGGCLPMLIQIPVFISLFNILSTTIELRHAPFFLWVQDLSAKDPYYVLPIIMGATMFLQQYTAPKTMDKTQSKIMMYLPGVYTFFFLNFPSGLVLYWLVNNTLTIVQQQILKKDNKNTAPA